MADRVRDQNRRYYNQEAEVYDENRYGTRAGRRLAGFHKRVLDLMLHGELPAGSCVLEMGCGTGRLLEHFAPKGYSLYGIDISPGMLAVARSRLAGAGSDVTIDLCEATVLPFEDNTFDAIYSILVVNLIPDYEKAFGEAARVLKPGGLFVFNVPNLTSVYALGGLYVNLRGRAMGSNRAGHRYSHWFTQREWRGALVRSGFAVEEVLGQPPHVRHVRSAAPLRARGLWQALSKSVYIKARRDGG